jgi:hypothetical protein
VVNWFRRRKKRVVVPRLHTRGEATTNTNRVDFAELTPGLPQFLAQAAYLQLTVFEALSEGVANAPTTEAKEAISEVAGHSLDKHHELVAELERRGTDAGDAMKQYAPSIDAYRARTHGATWLETVTTCYVTAGLLDDFSRRLATGLSADAAARIQQIYSSPDGHELLVEQLRSAIEADPRIASKLAMWGRRLVGDTLLVARTALALPPSGPSDEARLEPVFTEIIATHTRRMDALGLTA